MTRTYRTGPAAGSFPRPEIIPADNAAACLRVSRAADGRSFACALSADHRAHGIRCHGAERSGRMVPLEYGR